MRHPDTLEISGYMEGDLPPSRAAEVEAHLDSCQACAEVLGELRMVRYEAGNLPDRMPARDLWPAIDQAIRGGARVDPDVIHLFPPEARSPHAARAGLRLPIPHAVAAGLILALFSGVLGAWLADSGVQVLPGQEGSDMAWVQMVGSASPELEGSAREVARMEDLLARHRDQLDPETVEVLERNLGTIDRAIAESVAALRKDPQNLFLTDHLQKAIQAKGDYLREVALLVNPAG